MRILFMFLLVAEIATAQVKYNPWTRKLDFAGLSPFPSPFVVTGTAAGCIRLGEAAANGTDFIETCAPDSVTTSYTIKPPAAIGTAGQVWALPNPLGTSPYQTVWATPGGAATLTGPFFPNGPATAGTTAGYLNAGTAHYLESQYFYMPAAMSVGELDIIISPGATGASCSGGICGLNVQIRPVGMATVECQMGVLVSGSGGTNKDIATAGIIKLSPASGTTYSGGKCILDAGPHIWVSTSDDPAIRIMAGVAGGIGAFATGDLLTIISTKYHGYVASQATGNGSSLAITADLSGVTFTAGPTSPYILFSLLN
jgi:hypothetical protein